jgi:hypothetical protein
MAKYTEWPLHKFIIGESRCWYAEKPCVVAYQQQWRISSFQLLVRQRTFQSCIPTMAPNKSSLFILLLGVIRRLEPKPNRTKS